MAFNYKDLIDRLEPFKKAETGAWVLVVGCAPASAKCPDRTQTHRYELDHAVDHQADAEKDKSVNLAFLKKALKEKLKELKAVEENVAPPTKKGGSVGKKAPGSKKAPVKGRR